MRIKHLKNYSFTGDSKLHDNIYSENNYNINKTSLVPMQKIYFSEI